jgi:hypothetical protein
METEQGIPKSTVELIEQGLTVMRMENETQQAMAIQKPRDIEALTTKAIAELRQFPEFAKKAYYSIPYKDRSDGTEKTVYVEGPSIKAANALVRHWGNNASGFRVVGTDADRILIQGVFLDYETNMRRTAEISVSRMAKTKKGDTYSLDVTRLNMAIQAGGSKAVRNAILNSMPVGLVDMYFTEAKKLAARGAHYKDDEVPSDTIAQNTEKIYQKFLKLGVSKEHVQALVGRNPDIDSEEGALAFLVGILNAIEDGQTTIQELFAVPEGQAPLATPQRASAPQPTAPAPAAPPQEVSSAAGKEIPAHYKPMKSVIAGQCASCRKPIAKGGDIYYDQKKRTAYHKACV